MDLIGPLLPERLRPAAKAYLAALGAVIAILAATYASPVLVVIVNVLTALGVYVQPNAPVKVDVDSDS